MLILQNISYIHPDKSLLFDDINLSINHHEKIALIGNNGSGKSTLLKIIAQELQPSSGAINVAAEPYHVPQIFGQYDDLTIAQALKINIKIQALTQILLGNVTEENYNLLNDDWTVEERCREALTYWQLTGLHLSQKMATLSGGQKTKVFLAGISLHQPELILMDEPSNHLDLAGRQLVYDFIETTQSALIVVSHDRKLVNLLNRVAELDKRGITFYGGDYDFYLEQKQIENNALLLNVQSKEKALRKAQEKERESLMRQQRLDARGKKKQEKAGVARIMMNTLRNNAENSTSKLKEVHNEKIGGISKDLHDLRIALPDISKMKFGFENSVLHQGKVVFKATGINYNYSDRLVWEENLNFQLTSGERVALQGHNGSGKTTLIKLILGQIVPSIGTIFNSAIKAVYMDQDYSLIDNKLSIYEQAQQFNSSALQEHEVKIRLNRFLFSKDHWDKHCSTLSGGEKMRLILCCLAMSNKAPDLIILDEPTNNLDIQNIEILTAVINDYRGTLVVVSHDELFLAQSNINRFFKL